MGEILDYFKNKKNLVSLLVLGILILGIPLGVNLVKLQQIIKSRAAVDPITFTGPNVRQKNDGTWVATKPKIQLQLTSPLGPPGSPAPSPSGSPRPSPSSSPSPSPSTRSRVYIDPAIANSGSRVVMIATAPMGCETYIDFNTGTGLVSCPANLEVATCGGGNPQDSNQCWWKNTCTAGAAGSYTASFNARGTGCASNTTYTIR